jgi:hypothetical protein
MTIENEQTADRFPGAGETKLARTENEKAVSKSPSGGARPAGKKTVRSGTPQSAFDEKRVLAMDELLDLIRQVFPRTFQTGDVKDSMQWAAMIKVLVEALMKLKDGPDPEEFPESDQPTHGQTAESLQEWIREKEKDLGFRIMEDPER